jgi:hypothetical protein
MMRASMLAAVLLLLVPATCIPSACRAGSAAGYYVDSVEVWSEPPAVRNESGREYNVIIVRGAPDSLTSHLLAIAECAYPPRSLLAGLAARNNYEIGSDTARVPVWWCRGTRERRLPWAATRAALRYYLTLSQKFREGDYHEPGVRLIFTSDLIYTATIAHWDEYELEKRSFHDVYVADVELFWMYDDGTMWPRVTASRLVILTPEGRLLAVDGDGQGTENLSFSANRGVGWARRMH